MQYMQYFLMDCAHIAFVARLVAIYIGEIYSSISCSLYWKWVSMRLSIKSNPTKRCELADLFYSQRAVDMLILAPEPSISDMDK